MMSKSLLAKAAALPSPACGRRWPDEVGSDEGPCLCGQRRPCGDAPHPTLLRGATFSRKRENEGPRFLLQAVILLTGLSMPVLGAAHAQAPQQPGAGQVPTLSQQPNSMAPGAAGAEARAPSTKADQGADMPKSGDDAGTTTTFATQDDADKEVQWPCAQSRVSTISAGTIWSGPDLALGKDWEEDNAVAELAQKLASRRTTLDEANESIVAFAKEAGKDKNKQLTRLFVGTLDIINGNRSQLLDGIMRYARGQERLARRISDESDKISQAQENATAKDLGVARDQTNTDFAWDQRIFKERKQALSYVCETPSLLERRAYEIAKRIEAQI